MWNKALAVLVLGTVSPLCIAQAKITGQSSQAPKDDEKRSVTRVDYAVPGHHGLALQRPRVEVPEGDNSWVLTMETTGGFAPVHRSITISSRGRVTIDDSSGVCSYNVEGGFPELDRLIREANEAGWGGDLLPETAPTGWCFDCRQRNLRLNGRDADGKAYGHAAYWDDMTFVKLKKEVAAIYRAVEKIKRECPGAKG